MHDKKSQHVGNHGGRYTDLDGQTKQFTYVDHDVKTKVSVPTSKSNDMFQSMEEYREYLVQSILILPPSLLNERFYDFREDDGVVFLWNEKMLHDKGVPIETLRDMKVLLQNTMESRNLI